MPGGPPGRSPFHGRSSHASSGSRASHGRDYNSSAHLDANSGILNGDESPLSFSAAAAPGRANPGGYSGNTNGRGSGLYSRRNLGGVGSSESNPQEQRGTHYLVAGGAASSAVAARLSQQQAAHYGNPYASINSNHAPFQSPDSSFGALSSVSPSLSMASSSVVMASAGRTNRVRAAASVGQYYRERVSPAFPPSASISNPNASNGPYYYRDPGAAVEGSAEHTETRRSTRRPRTPPHHAASRSTASTSVAVTAKPSRRLESGGVLGTAIPPPSAGLSITKKNVGNRNRIMRSDDDDEEVNYNLPVFELKKELDREQIASLDAGGLDHATINGHCNVEKENPYQQHESREASYFPSFTSDAAKADLLHVNEATTNPALEINEQTEHRFMIIHLRNMTNNALHNAIALTSPSPSMAAFYGSILYARTQLVEDAFLYAKALAANDELKRAVFILNKCGLLLFSTATGAGANETGKTGTVLTTNAYTSSTRISADLRIEAVLLAAHCHSSLREWEEALILLEEACRYPFPNHTYSDGEGHNKDHDPYLCKSKLMNCTESIIESGDDPRLILLADQVANSSEMRNNDFDGHTQSSTRKNNTGIHPVARLCTLRGIAYDELSNPTRAASFLTAALRIDSKCVQALDYLFNRHLLTAAEERDLVLELQFDVGMEWLRDVYRARLSLNPFSSDRQDGRNSFAEFVADDNENGQDIGIHLKTLGEGFSARGHVANNFDLDGVQKDDDNQFHSRRIAAAVATPVGSSPPSILTMPHHTPQMNFLIRNGERVHLNVMDASSIHMSQTPSIFSVTSPRNVTSVVSKTGNNHKLLGHASDGNGVDKNGDNTKPCVKTSKCFLPEIEEAFENLNLKHFLSKSPEVLSLTAIRAYSTYNLLTSLTYCNALAAIDPLCPTAANVHIATLAGLGLKRPLFELAHNLVDANPKSATAWYAVGCYYHVCRRFDLAQRYFCRATRLNPRSAECWIAFGCAFAACDESDQALASYRAAQRLHTGSHYPLLYMGMEYLRTNHLSLGGHFLKGARSLGMEDPLCCNELGVWSYKKGEWMEAVGWFQLALRLCAESRVTDVAVTGMLVEADNSDEMRRDLNERNKQRFRERPQLSNLECIEHCQDTFWETTIFNLGQSYRKSRQFSEAAACFEKCVSLCPGKAAPYAALGFTKHLIGDVDGAIESYHQSLSRKPDDPFASEMLNRAIHEALNTPEPLSIMEESQEGSFMTSTGDGPRNSSGLLFSLHSSDNCADGSGVESPSSFTSLPAAAQAYTPQTMHRTEMNMSTTMLQSGLRSTVKRWSTATDQAHDFSFDDSDIDLTMT